MAVRATAPTALKAKTEEARKSDSHSHSEYLRILKSPKRVKVTVTSEKLEYNDTNIKRVTVTVNK